MYRRVSVKDYRLLAGGTPYPNSEPTLPQYQPPTQRFLEELEQKEMITVRGGKLAAYIFNRHYLGNAARPPLLASYTYIPTYTRLVARYLNTWSHRLQRPIISIDLPGTGESELPSRNKDGHIARIAEARVEALDRLGLNGRIDLTGVCIGGTVAAKMAIELQERAGHIITVSTPGFGRRALLRLILREDYCEPSQTYLREAGVQDNVKGAGLFDLSEDGFRNRAAVRRTIASIGSVSRSALVEDLHPATRWYDICGDADPRIGWSNRVREIEERNAHVPGSSEVTVIEGVGHTWGGIRMVPTVWDAARALQK